VRRSDGVIERVAMFDGSHALVLEWCVDPTGGSGWEPVRDGPWVEVSRLRARYATVGTFTECEAWKMEQEKPKPRYAFESIASSDAHKITDTVYRFVDTRTGQRLLGPEIVDLLNAADRKTEGGE
jgi:hypothetical protein